MESNEVLDKLPAHLMSMVIEQPYNDYTALDHAIWRYVMRRNTDYLSKVAHGSYTDGLKRTGISVESIPHMYGMNRILSDIGWAAVAVDGFIPPSAFMEFQAYNVLVIAADIRPLDQIEYTPAPDIIHEAAGHAPIIADPDYAYHLRFFGEIGCRAFSSARDYELYEAIRHLSILKADPYSSKSEIANAESLLASLETHLGPPSEMALIRNLHWWTVEYGLIGSLDDFKIYGAGLLSSIGESMNCMKPTVKKLPYSLDAVNTNFDITTQQPQLFVTPDFDYLNAVLNQFADGMALRKGGVDAVLKAQQSANVATLVFDTGIQLSGIFEDCIIEGGQPVYIRTKGATALAFDNKELDRQGKQYHVTGYASPVGPLMAGGYSLALMNEFELESAGFSYGVFQELIFESGVKVKGVFNGITRRNGKNIILHLTECEVVFKDKILFTPDMGRYDMAIGESIISGYQGPADPLAFGFTFEAPAERTHKIQHSADEKLRHTMYQQMRNIRKGKVSDEEISFFSKKVISNYPKEWLLLLELLEYMVNKKIVSPERAAVEKNLTHLATTQAELKVVIEDGIRLC